MKPVAPGEYDRRWSRRTAVVTAVAVGLPIAVIAATYALLVYIVH